jgi:hypothetical protein
MMIARAAALLLFACLAKSESASDKSWKNLGHTIKQSSYTVAMRDGRCITGHIESLDDQYVTVNSLKLDRKGIVRVGDGTSLSDHDPIYSGRSSWSDLLQSEPNKYEFVELEMKDRSTRKCRKFSAAEDEAACDGSRISKSEVTRGYYVRLAPATEWEHHAARENVTILAPRTWFDYALFPKIKVLLYDEALPQENVKVSCKAP